MREPARSAGRRRAGNLVTLRAPMRISPLSGRSSPAMICSNVDAPLAGGPTIAVWVLLGNVNVTSRMRLPRLSTM